MGESRRERAGLIAQLANMEPYPESVPINNLVQVEGTPLTGTEALDPFEFVRTIAVARITMPRAMVRLSAGREQMDEALQALCFLAGANSIFYGDQLLTTSNPQAEADRKLLERLGIRAEAAQQMPAAIKAAASMAAISTPRRTERLCIAEITVRAIKKPASFFEAAFLLTSNERSLLLVHDDLIERAAIGEMRLLRFLPAAEHLLRP